MPLRVPICLAATRPAFLSVTLVAVILGIAATIHTNNFRSITLATITLLFALIAHAGANVINDYYDALNGSDDANTDYITPFTGGSRFIQNHVLTKQQTRYYGYSLFAVVIPAGLWLLNQSGPDLLWIGLIGLFFGWAYSAPPLQLQSRGLGELAIMVAWACVVMGSAYVQSQEISVTTLYAAATYVPLVANVLFVNQIPDRDADMRAGKNTLIVRYSSTIAPWGSLTLYGMSFTLLTFGLVSGVLPHWASLALLGTIPAQQAVRQLFVDPIGQPHLRLAIAATITSCLLFGLMLSVGLIIG